MKSEKAVAACGDSWHRAVLLNMWSGDNLLTGFVFVINQARLFSIFISFLQ